MHQKNLEWRLAVDDEVLQRLAGNAGSHSRNLLRSYLYFNFARVIDENAIAAIRQIERNTFVRLVTRSSSIPIPYTDGLPYEDRAGALSLYYRN